MHPVLVTLGPVTISTYGAVLAVAFLLAIRLASHATARTPTPLGPLSSAAIVDWACGALLGGIVGGRLFYVVGNWEAYRAQPFEILALWHGGLIWYGGLLGGVVATAWYLRRRGFAVLPGLDQVVPFVAFGHALGRIGCFFNGCCLGKPGLLVPVQLIESAGLLALYVWLRGLQTPVHLRHPGRVFGVYLVSYGAMRWLLESWRDQPLLWAGWTLQQLISIPLILFGLYLVRCQAPKTLAPPR